MRQADGQAGARVGDHGRVDAEGVADELGGEQLARRSLRDHPAVGEADHRVAVGGGRVEVVQDPADGQPVLDVQAAHERHDLELVAHVEVGRRLVEQQHAGALGERDGQPGALALAAGQRVDEAVGVARGVGDLQRPGDRLAVGGAQAAEAAEVRLAAELDERGDRDAGHRLRALGQQREALGDRAGRERGDVLAVEHDRAGGRAQDAAERAQQRALARAVGSDQRGDPAGRELDVDGLDDRRAAEPDGEPARDDRRRHGRPGGRRLTSRTCG